MKQAKEISFCGICVLGALILIMVIIKLTEVTSGSWWRVLLPIGILVGFNVMYIVVGFIYLTWTRIPERADGEEATILVPHELSTHHVPSMLFLIILADNAVR